MSRPSTPVLRPTLLALVLLTVAGCTTPATQTALPPPAERPNVVVIFADDLGYGDLGSYGHPLIRTPHLDRMAAEGMRLTSFYAMPSCAPSRASLLTGRYPARSGFPGGGVGSDGGLDPSEITLAEGLKERGYRTKMVGKWHLGYAREELLPTSQGFDSYFGLPYSNDMIRPWVQTDVPLRLYRDTERLEGEVDQAPLTERYTEEAVDFIRSADGEPFFLYLAHSMPHMPVSTTEEFRGRSRAGLYGDVIETIDWSTGQVLEALEEEGLAENTIVVFTSDNGPWINAPPRMIQAGIEPWDAGSPGLLRGAKGTTYEGGVRVPCIVRWPGQIPGGQVSADIARTMDLFTTLLTAAGADVPQDRVIDGLDLMPLLKGEAPSPALTYYYWRGRRLQGVREESWKLRLEEGLPASESDLIERAELYHLERDPSERFNVAREHPEVVARLARMMRGFSEEAQLASR